MRFRISYRRYRLPFRAPVRTAHGTWLERDGLIVRLEDESGVTGLGEAAPVPGFVAETADELEVACRSLGKAVDDARLDSLPVRAACLRNALDTARREIARKHAGPEHQAGTPAYLGVAALVSAGRAALPQITLKAESGFRVFKWKVGVGDLADELALLDDICAALPGGATLRLDANGAWNRRQAERWLERCADCPVEFVEQPCFAGATERASQRLRADDLLLGLAGSFPTPIALDESIAGDGDVERWVGAGWPGIFVVKPSLHGNVMHTVELLARAKAKAVFSSALETAIGAKAALRVAFSWTGESRALGFGVWPLFADARFDGPAAAPFLRAEDVSRIDTEAVWNALS